MCCKNVARCANVSAENVFLFSIGFSEYRSTMSMFHKVYPLEPYSPGDPPWPSQSKADLGLVYEFFLKNVNFSVFIFGCTAIFSYFVSFLVSTSSALKEHLVNLCSLPSPLSYLRTHPKHSKVGPYSIAII